MTTISLDPDPTTGSVTLDIFKTATINSITRTNANGTEAVRVSAGQLPSVAIPGSVVRTNYVTNPSFETGVSGYVNPMGSYATLSNPLTGGLFGSRHGRVTTHTVFGGGTAFGIQRTLNLTGGKTYVASFHGKGSAGVIFRQPEMYYPASGTSAFPALLTASAASGWTQYGGKFTVPGTGTVSVEVRFLGYYPAVPESGYDTPVGTILDFDGMMIEEATWLAPYFDGATADSTGFDYAWTGTANASTSTLTTSGGRLIVTDYEAAHGANTYNVYHSDGTFVTKTVNLVLDKPWLMVPIAPNYSEQVEVIMNYSANRETSSTIHKIINRADPLVIMGKLSTRSGSLEIWTSSIADANRIIRVFDRGEAVLLKQTVEGMDMYLTVLNISVDPYSPEGEDHTLYRLMVQYQEVIRPYGNIAGALGWTFDQLAVEYASFDAVTSAFATFDDLTIGDN